jgi:hypothetical protein
MTYDGFEAKKAKVPDALCVRLASSVPYPIDLPGHSLTM